MKVPFNQQNMIEPSELPLQIDQNRLFVQNIFFPTSPPPNLGIILAEESSEGEENEEANQSSSPCTLVEDTSSEINSQDPDNAQFDFIFEDEHSEGEASRFDQLPSLPIYEEIIDETPESSENGTDERNDLVGDVLVSETSSEGQIDEWSTASEDVIVMETDLSESDASGDHTQSIRASQHSLQYDETDSSDNDNDEATENDFSNEIIPESSNESEDESDQGPIDTTESLSHRSTSNQIAMHLSPISPSTSNAHIQMTDVSLLSVGSNAPHIDVDDHLVDTIAEQERIEPNSSNFTGHEIIPETESEESDNSSEIFEMIEPRDRDEIQNSPSFDHDSPLVLQDHVISPLNNDQNEPVNVTLPDDQNSGDSEDDGDDETIMTVPLVPIEISPRSRELIERIERFISSAIDDLQNGRELQIVVQNRRNWDNCFIENERFVLLPITEARCRHIKSTSCLSVIFFLLAEIHELLSTNRRCTVRELYYRDVSITQKQENVNEALMTICCLLDAAPWELGVLSTSKGLIAGPLEIHLPENVIINCNIDKNGITLPHLTSGIVDLRTTATHILVVEKDTVFKKLLDCNIIERWNNKTILITGKGYPDTNTRLILNKLRELHALPIDIVTDADPYGVEIMLTYRHGSMSMSNLAESLAVPSVRWLGIFPSDIQRFGIRAVEMTDQDKRKLNNMLNRPFINDHVHRELLIMKQANLKAEIEAISDSSCTYLIDVYLRNKIDNNNGI